MKETFQIKHRIRSITYTIIYGVALFVIVPLYGLVTQAGIARLLLSIFGLTVLLIGFLVNLSKSTYKLELNNGMISERDWLHRTRVLRIQDIQWIRPRAYTANRYNRHHGVDIVQAPCLVNEFFKNFPRYRITEKLITVIHASDSNVKIDINYSDRIKNTTI